MTSKPQIAAMFGGSPPVAASLNPQRPSSILGDIENWFSTLMQSGAAADADRQRRANLAYNESLQRGAPSWMAAHNRNMASWGEPLKQAAVSGFGAADLGAIGPMMGAIKAYHGSPHSFDKFSLNHIGSGEGAQAYGHGLYFAENPAVAKNYQQGLAKTAATIDGKSVVEMFMDGSLAKTLAEKTGLSRGDSIEAANLMADSVRTGRELGELLEEKIGKAQQFGPDEVARVTEMGKRLTPIAPKATKGELYEVELSPDKEDLLDWDLPLSKQPESVRQALSKAGYVDLVKDAHKTGGAIYESSKIAPGDFRDPVTASSALRKAGIPGIKYLDQGSRGAEGGTSNFVMFDDEMVKIKARK
jgi:hypothetical protein